MKTTILIISFIVIFVSLLSHALHAQSGDQILDGIGETGLTARYTFNENVKDWSRNNLHGSIQGSYEFVSDRLFNSVLGISDESETYITLPGEVLKGQESLSISAWVFPASDNNNQYVFDFGTFPSSHFFISPSGTRGEKGLTAQIVNGSENHSVRGPSMNMFQWNHIAIVIDAPSKTLRLYLNGDLIDEVSGVSLALNELFENAGKNKLYIGRSIAPDFTRLNARLYDFRVYRIPLSSDQISNIRMNALQEGLAQAQKRREAEQRLPEFPVSESQLYNKFLLSVPDVEVETTVGHLPRLPRYIQGVYRDNIDGPDVRVIWPAPENNSLVLKSGTYTVTGTVPGSDLQPKAIVTIKPAAPPVAPGRTLEPFELDQVSLDPDEYGNKTKFIENRDKFINGLASSNPDNFLYMFRNAFGQEQPDGAEALGGWDSQETKLRGHATGHYLTALAQSYGSLSYDPTLRKDFAQKMDYMVEKLYNLSQLSGKARTPGGKFVSDPTAVPPGPGKIDYSSDLSEDGIRTDYENWGEGFISAYPPDQFIMLEQGARYGTDETRIWAPYYTLHKILAGLMDVYEVTGNKKALKTVKGMGNWVHARLSEVSNDSLLSMWNRYIAGEFGGMNEAMARLSRITGEPKYLETARLFDNIRMFFGGVDRSHGLAKNVDMIRGLHSNQHIPQIMGALEIYRDSESPEYYRIADNFWTKATGDYMYSIGGVAGARTPNNAECFVAQPATLYENGFSAGGQNETCATYNMLKLTRNLFLYNPDAKLMDYYERSLYNHILASVAKDSPANTYHVPLRPGSVKQFENADMSGFTCCNGTALESSTKLQNSIYFKSADNQTLYVNLFVSSTLHWSDRDITISQVTSFPKEDHSKLIINGDGDFDMQIRVPKWATGGFIVKINGIIQDLNSSPGSYLSLKRNWENGDSVEIKMPFEFRLEPVMDQQNIASLFYGPILLAAQEPEARVEWRKVTLNAKDLSRSISGDPSQLEFTIDGITFKPFYETYDRYSVYLDVNLQ